MSIKWLKKTRLSIGNNYCLHVMIGLGWHTPVLIKRKLVSLVITQ